MGGCGVVDWHAGGTAAASSSAIVAVRVRGSTVGIGYLRVSQARLPNPAKTQ